MTLLATALHALLQRLIRLIDQIVQTLGAIHGAHVLRGMIHHQMLHMVQIGTGGGGTHRHGRRQGILGRRLIIHAHQLFRIKVQAQFA